MQRSWCKTVLGGLILLAFVSGCAAKPYQSDPNKSFALNVMRAAGAMDIKDVSQKELAKKGDKAMPGKIRGNESGLVDTAVATLAGGLLFGAAYGLTGDKAPENYPAILAWMPQEMAATPQEAQEKMTEIILEAMEKALQEVALPVGYLVNIPHIPYISGKKQSFVQVDIQGPGCEDILRIRCGYSIGPQKPKNGPSPNFLGGETAWTWDFKHLNQVMAGGYSFGERHYNPKTIEARFPDLELYQQLSLHLPEWVFIYLTPSKGLTMISEGPGKGFFRGFTLINKGQHFSFVAPST